MPTNEFLQFATAGGANVESQVAYSADSNRTNGNQPGVAVSALNNKAIRQANFVASIVAQFVANQTGADVLDNTVTAQFLAQLNAAMVAVAPVVKVFTTGSGTYNLPYYFFVASANATAGATYTNNSITYTVLSTIAAGLQLSASGSGAPLVSGTLTKTGGSGDATITFYAYRAPVYLEVIVVGAGGGGGGGGTTSGTAATDGASSTFGTSLLTAAGGTKGGNGGAFAPGGAGGAATVNSPAVSVLSVTGGTGQGGTVNNSASTSATPIPAGAAGGANPLGGAGAGAPDAVGNPGTANTGAGGAGGGIGSTSNAFVGYGGGAGAYLKAFIPSPSATYAYAVGTGGSAGGAGTSGAHGGAGADGQISVTAHFQ